MSGEYITTAEAAEALGRTQQTIHRWIKEGYITGVRRSPSRAGKGRITIPCSEIDRLLEPESAA